MYIENYFLFCSCYPIANETALEKNLVTIESVALSFVMNFTVDNFSFDKFLKQGNRVKTVTYLFP